MTPFSLLILAIGVLLSTYILLGFKYQTRFFFSLPQFLKKIFAALHFFLGLLNMALFGWLCLITYSSWFLPLVFRIIGGIIALVGLELFTGGLATLGRRAYLPKKGEKLFKKGFFSRVRHPIYLGAFLTTFGLSVAFNSKYAFVYSLVLFVVLYLVSFLEELDLVDRFGDEYRRYQKEVPHFFPKLFK